MAILDQHGNAIDRQVLAEPQTAKVAQLKSFYLTPMLEGLTPAGLARALRQADLGYLTDQHRLFSDMEDRDAHLLCEVGKRKLALQNLDWDIVPPRNATAAETAAAEWVKEVLADAVDPLEDLLLALMDAPGHGFAAVELEWGRWDGEWLPAFHPRPQEWFQLTRDRQELRLRDHASQDGTPLLAFGWVLHTHGKAKTGYLGRLGLYRALVWPFIYKNYGIGDLAEFLETYGLPMIVGKYFSGASDEEKASLLRAVSDLGHDARAIMPQDMSLEIQKITGSGDAVPHLSMVDWAERSMSKAILGQVLSAEAKATGMGSGVADLHGEVRRDILKADAKQIGATLTRDLVYPLIALNRSGVNGLGRCPRFVFDTGEAEDMEAMAKALPELVAMGMRVPVSWPHEKLRIPQADDKEPVLTITRPDLAVPPDMRAQEKPAGKKTPADLAALSAFTASETSDPGQVALNAALANLPGPAIDAAMRALLKPAIAALQDGATPDEAGDALLSAFPHLDDTALRELLARAIFVADIWGRLADQA